MRLRYYMGYRIDTGAREVFRNWYEPTATTHGHIYAAVVGPFRTKRGAVFMAEHGRGNPHIQTVADAERWGKRNALQS